MGVGSSSQVVIDADGHSHTVTYTSGILVAKAKVAKIENIPRNEICGLILLARLVTAVLPGLTDKPSSFLPILDSRCTIQSVEAESKILKDYFNNRVEEWDEHRRQWIEDGMVVEPIHYTASANNIADLATRGNVVRDQLDEKSTWQRGPDYLRYTRDDSWPINRDMLSGQDCIPDNEKLVRVFSLRSVDISPCVFDSVRWIADRHRDLLKVLRIVARLITSSKSCKRTDILLEPSSESITQARHLLEIVYGQDTASEVLSGKLVGLAPKLSKGRFVTRGRFGSGLANVLGLVELPILLPDSQLAYLIMVQAHLETHSAAKSTLARSRTQAWIVRGFNLAVKVCQECNLCKLDRKVKLDQKMGYLP